MPKIVDHQEYRKELLDKCFDLFAEKGYSAITMRQIAEGLNVSTGTLYHYFPSKRALFEQLVEEICQQDVLMAATEMAGLSTLEERLEALGKLFLKKEDYFIKWTYVLIDFSQNQDSEEYQNSPTYKRVNEQYKQAIHDFLGIQDPQTAYFVLSLMNGLILERLWGNTEISITEQFALLGKMLTAYLHSQKQVFIKN